MTSPAEILQQQKQYMYICINMLPQDSNPQLVHLTTSL